MHSMGLWTSSIAGARLGKGDIMGTMVKSSVLLASIQAPVLVELVAWLIRTGSAGESLIASVPSPPNGGKGYSDIAV